MSRHREASAHLSLRSAARMLGVSPSTVRRMVDSGALNSWRTLGGHRRLTPESVAAAMSGLNGTRPAATPIGADETAALASVLVVEGSGVEVAAWQRRLTAYATRLQLHCATDSTQAQQMLPRVRPGLIILGLDSEPEAGFPLLRAIREPSGALACQVLALTSLSPEAVAARGGVDETVTVYRPPLHDERVYGFIDAFLAGRRRPSASMAPWTATAP